MAYEALPSSVLSTLVESTLIYANEPEIHAKYTPEKLYPLFRANYRELIFDILRVSCLRPTVQFETDIAAETRVTILPANVGVIERICVVDEETGIPRAELYSRSRDNPSGPILRLEGNMIRWLPFWSGSSETITIEYTPNGDLDIASGTIAGNDSSNSINTFGLDTTPDEGYFDRRPYVYRGNLLRWTTGSANPTGYTFFPIVERIISDYLPNPPASAKPKVTVAADFDFNPTSLGSSTITYEIVPSELAGLTQALALRTAAMIHSIEGNAKRGALLRDEYDIKMRTIQLHVAEMDAKRGQRFEHDTYPLNQLFGVI